MTLEERLDEILEQSTLRPTEMLTFSLLGIEWTNLILLARSGRKYEDIVTDLIIEEAEEALK